MQTAYQFVREILVITVGMAGVACIDSSIARFYGENQKQRSATSSPAACSSAFALRRGGMRVESQSLEWQSVKKTWKSALTGIGGFFIFANVLGLRKETFDQLSGFFEGKTMRAGFFVVYARIRKERHWSPM